ncbi:MAG: hypothetical protein JSS09_08450, partial [Verrucomicrobia bacterium]|nr:hypothetical protein [Verrucomicrobiota bacterium]
IYAGRLIQNVSSGTASYGIINIVGGFGADLTGTNFSFTGNITTNDGSFNLVNSGTATFSSISIDLENGDVSSVNFIQSGGGTIVTAADITITGGTGSISFENSVILSGDVSMTAINSGITFGSTVDGYNSLTLLAASGDITFTGAVGGITRVGDLTISNAGSVSAPAVTVKTLTQTAGSVLTTITGSIDTIAQGGINLTGTAFSFGSDIQTNGIGGFALTNTGSASFSSSSDLLIGGGFTQTGNGTISAPSSLIATGGAISFNGPVILAGDATLYSLGEDMTFAGAITGAHSLTLNACTGGSITLGDVGTSGTPLTSLVTYSSELNETGTVYAVVQVDNFCTTEHLSGTIDTGGLDYIVSGNVILDGDTIINAGVGRIIFTGTINSITGEHYSLTANSSTNTIFGGDVGTEESLSALTTNAGGILSVKNVVTTGAQSYGDDIITLKGHYTTTNSNFTASGVVTIGLNMIINIGSGNVLFESTIDEDFALSIQNTGDTTLEGLVGSKMPLASFDTSAGELFSSIGMETVGDVTIEKSTASIRGTFLNANASMTFPLEVILTGDTILSTQAEEGGGTINLLGIVNGNYDLTITAGALGTVNVHGRVGHSTPLDALDVHGSIINQLASVIANSVNYHSTVYLSGDVTALTGDITMNSNVILNTSVLLTSVDADIVITGTINAAQETYNLNLLAENGNIILGGSIGNRTPINDIRAEAGDSVTFKGALYQGFDQTYSANTFYIDSRRTTTFKAEEGTVVFSGGTIELLSGSNLTILTNDKPITLENVQSSYFGSVLLNAGFGSALVGYIGNTGSIGNFDVEAGSFSFSGPITSAGRIDIETHGDIKDSAGYTLTAMGRSVFMNAINGQVGSLLNPIIVNFSNASSIVLGSSGNVYLTGTVPIKAVSCYSQNKPRFIIINEKARTCSTFGSLNSQIGHFILPANIFFVAGVTTEQGSLAGNPYYYPDFYSKFMETLKPILIFEEIPAKDMSENQRIQKDVLEASIGIEIEKIQVKEEIKGEEVTDSIEIANKEPSEVVDLAIEEKKEELVDTLEMVKEESNEIVELAIEVQEEIKNEEVIDSIEIANKESLEVVDLAIEEKKEELVDTLEMVKEESNEIVELAIEVQE